MHIIEQASWASRPKGPNEDALGWSDHAAWVLDGATGLSDTPLLPVASDAAWISSAYQHGIARRIPGWTGSLPDLMTLVADDVIDLYAAFCLRPPEHAYERPSTCLAMVQETPGWLWAGKMGDCKVVIRKPDGQVVESPASPLDQYDAQVSARYLDLMASGQVPAGRTALDVMMPELRALRSLANTPEGYWVLALDRLAPRHMDLMQVRLDGPVVGMVVSDGLLRLVEGFQIYPNAEALLDAALDQGLDALLHQLRTAETAEGSLDVYPRIKPLDDATAIVFSTGPL